VDGLALDDDELEDDPESLGLAGAGFALLGLAAALAAPAAGNGSSSVAESKVRAVDHRTELARLDFMAAYPTRN
jgi:hypothetical protein